MPNLQTYRLADNPNQQEWVFFDDATQLPTAPQVTGGLVNTANWVWDTGALMWAKETQAGGGGGGGPATIADGADVAEGATTDAAIVTGAAGTISGKLRGLVTILASVWDSGNGRVKVDASGVAVPVTGTFFQATQPVSAAALPLPTGAATEATLGTLLKPADTLTKVSTLDTITNPVTVTGSVTASGTLSPSTSGGLSTFHLVSAATTNATNIKATPGQLYGWYVYNSNAAARKLAFHDTAGTPTAGAAVAFAIVIPPNAGANVIGAMGISFATGIAITTVTGLADNDSNAVTLNDLIINLWYK